MLHNTEQEQVAFSRRKNHEKMLRKIHKNSSNFLGESAIFARTARIFQKGLYQIFTRTPTIFQENIPPQEQLF